MSLSIDQAKLEELQKFSTFFDFISNPKQYQEILGQVESTLKAMDATIKAHTTVENAGQYLATAQAKLEAASLAEKASLVEITASKAAWAEELTTAQEKLAKRELAASALERANVLGQKKIDVSQAALAEQVKELEKVKATLATDRKNLDAQLEEFTQTRAKVAALLGA